MKKGSGKGFEINTKGRVNMLRRIFFLILLLFFTLFIENSLYSGGKCPLHYLNINVLGKDVSALDVTGLKFSSNGAGNITTIPILNEFIGKIENGELVKKFLSLSGLKLGYADFICRRSSYVAYIEAYDLGVTTAIVSLAITKDTGSVPLSKRKKKILKWFKKKFNAKPHVINISGSGGSNFLVFLYKNNGKLVIHAVRYYEYLLNKVSIQEIRAFIDETLLNKCIDKEKKEKKQQEKEEEEEF